MARAWLAVVLSAGALVAPLPAVARVEPGQGLEGWLSATSTELNALLAASDAELESRGTQRLLRVYLDAFEPIENWYGPGAPYGVEPLATLVTRSETRFHAALQARGVPALRDAMKALRTDVEAVRVAARRSGVPLEPRPADLSVPGALQASPQSQHATTPEIQALMAAVSAARDEFRAGRAREALARIEAAYLQQFEPMEARLPGDVTRQVESLIHLQLRPLLARNADAAQVEAVFGSLNASLAQADAALAGGSSFWFGVANAGIIIVREGLEAVLLIAAMLAYLAGIGAQSGERRRIYVGAGLGVAASFATWLVARTLMPVSGAGREVMEGVTALIAVAVLVYVSNWLFQKTYIHDWKNYLRERVGRAVTAGSSLAMAGLAFAAVYREGFETVLFYQALGYETSSGAVLAGFVPGLLLIMAIGAAIIRLGLRLPLRQLFAVTNSILLWLAFAFVGKGIYNLQEAGLFAPHPLAWAPDHEALRQIFGFYPLVETLLAQLAFVTLILATYVFYRRRQISALQSAPAARERVPAGAS